MSAQISGLNQAARNANDGVSMIQTAESAYVEVGDMLQRMRQIAVQSASETYAASSRTALNLEWQALAKRLIVSQSNNMERIPITRWYSW